MSVPGPAPHIVAQCLFPGALQFVDTLHIHGTTNEKYREELCLRSGAHNIS